MKPFSSSSVLSVLTSLGSIEGFLNQQISSTQISVEPGTFFAIDTADSTPLYTKHMMYPMILDFTNNGINGLDTGSLQPNSMYYLYLMGDVLNKSPIGFVGSLNGMAPYFPEGQFPTGYNLAYKIGYFKTDESGNILRHILTGNAAQRLQNWLAYFPVLTEGIAISPSRVDCSDGVPNDADNIRICISTSITATSLSTFASIYPGAALIGTDTEMRLYGPIGTPFNSELELLAQLTFPPELELFGVPFVGNPSIKYNVGTEGDMLDISLKGFYFDA